MSAQDCLKIKRKLSDPDDRKLFEKNLKELMDGGVPASDAYSQAAELTMESILEERNELAGEIRDAGGYLADISIEDLLSTVKQVKEKSPEAASEGEDVEVVEKPLYSRKQKKLTFDETEQFKTGVPVTFNFIHSKDSATKIFGKPDKDSPYGRGYEPSGRFVTPLDSPSKKQEGFDTGELTFDNPLVVANNSLQWKKELSDAYGGKTGKELSKAVIADGFDGIVTIDSYGKGENEVKYASETVDLTTFDETKAVYSRKVYKTDIKEDFGSYEYGQIYDTKGRAIDPKTGTRGGLFGYPVTRSEYNKLQSEGANVFRAAYKGPETTGNEGWFLNKDSIRYEKDGRSVFDKEKYSPLFDEVLTRDQWEFGVDRKISKRSENKDVNWFKINNSGSGKKSPAWAQVGADTLFSRQKATGTTKTQVDNWISKPKSKLGNWISVEVVQTVDELPPDPRTGEGHPDDVRGMRIGDTVYLVADNITDSKDALLVLSHEVVGHAGLERLLGKAGMASLVKQIQQYKRDGKKEITEIIDELKLTYVDESGKYNLSERQESSEVMAKLAEVNPDFGFVRKIMNKIKFWLTRHGFGRFVDFDNVHLENLLIRAARTSQTNYSGFMEDGGKLIPSYMIAKEEFADIEQSEYEQAVAKGLPMDKESRMQRARDMGFDVDTVWYHGSRADIDSFSQEFLGENTGAQSAKKGFFFTASPIVASGYAAIGDSRHVIELKKSMKRMVSEARAKGDKFPLSNRDNKDLQKVKAELERIEFVGDTKARDAGRKSRKLAEQATEALWEMHADSDIKNFDEFIERNKNKKEIKMLLGRIETGKYRYFASGSNVTPVYAKYENTFIFDYEGKKYREETYVSIISKALKAGHDSVLFKNTFDGGSEGYNELTDILYIKNQENIRSTSAAFDPEFKDSPNLLYSRKPQTDSRPVSMVVGKDEDGADIVVNTMHPSKDKQGKLKTFWKEWFNKEGNLGVKAFALRTEMEGAKNADETNVKFFLGALQRATRMSTKKGGYGKRYSKLTSKQTYDMDLYLRGQEVNIPSAVKEALDIMRTSLDSMSGELQKTIMDNIQYKLEMLSEKKANEALAAISASNRGEEVDWESIDSYIASKYMLMLKIQSNEGSYLNRSYRIFDDPKWADKVRKNTELTGKANTFFTDLFTNQGLEGKNLEDAVTGAIEELLSKGEDHKDMLSFMSSPILGQKNLSILKKRKDIPQKLLDVLGEYRDPRLNFARSMSKMSYLVANHIFLKGVRDKGLGVFLSKKPRGRFGHKIKVAEQESMMPITGLYGAKEFVDALEDATKPENIQGWLSGLLAVNSTAKYGKTVLSPTTASRNFMSAMMFTVMNGHFNYFHAAKAFKHTFADLASKNMDSREYLVKLIKLGVLHDNPYSAELKAALDDFANMDTLEDTGVIKGFKGALNIAQSFYQAGDDFWKIIGFENDKSMLIKQGMSTREAEKEAAQRIRNGYPTYSMVPKFIRSLRRFPFVGTFTSFPWEMLRTTGHQALLLKEDTKAGRKSAVARRVVGITIATGAAYAVSQVMMKALGLDDEDDENIRELAPEWQKNSQLAYIGYDESGILRYLDLSALDPYTYLKKPITALLNDNNPGALDKIFDGMKELTDPFISEEIGWGAIADIAYNTNHDTGRPIYTGGNLLDGSIEFGNYMRKRLQPGVVDNIERIRKSVTGIVESSGRSYVLTDEIISVFGFRLTALDIPSSIKYKAFEFSDLKKDAGIIMSQAAKSRGTVSESKLRKAYRTMVRVRSKAYQKMTSSIDAAKALGLTDQQIAGFISDAGIGKKDVSALLSGEIPQWEPPINYLSDIMKKSLRLTKDPEKRADIEDRFRNRDQMLKDILNE